MSFLISTPLKSNLKLRFDVGRPASGGVFVRQSRLSSAKAIQPNRALALPWLALAVLLLGPFGVAPAHAQPLPTVAEIDVRVTGYQSEGALDQVRVELVVFPDQIIQWGFTDSSGRMAFLQVALGAYLVRVSKPGYTSLQVRVDIRRGERVKNVNVQMQRVKTDQNPAPGGLVSTRTLFIPKPARKEFQKGVEFLQEKKDPRQSLKYFQKATEIYPDYYEAYFLLGMASFQLNSPDQAQAALGKAIDLNPQFLAPYHPFSVLLIRQKRYQEAERLLLRAMELDQQGWRWPFELARCYAGRGLWDQALTHGLMARDRPDAPPRVHLLLADLYSGSNDSDKAVAALENFAQLAPDSPYMPRVREALSKLRKRD